MSGRFHTIQIKLVSDEITTFAEPVKIIIYLPGIVLYSVPKADHALTVSIFRDNFGQYEVIFLKTICF